MRNTGRLAATQFIESIAPEQRFKRGCGGDHNRMVDGDRLALASCGGLGCSL